MAKAIKTRIHLLDAIRGITQLSMIAYHGIWNLVHLFGAQWSWYTGIIGYIWQQSICWTFILLAGFCFHFGKNHLKRGMQIFCSGILVSITTHLLIPSARITFGILTFTGSSVLIVTMADKWLRKIPAGVGALISALLFFLMRNCNSGSLGFGRMIIAALPQTLYRDLFTTYLGFPTEGFRSSDYFSLLPWIFLFLIGYFLYWILEEQKLNEKLFLRGKFPLLNWMGRHSLLIYLLHQPILYGLCLMTERILGR